MKYTHLVSWLSDGYTHCQHGSQEWCEGYLKNAAATLERYENALREIADDPTSDLEGTRAYAVRVLAGEDQ